MTYHRLLLRLSDTSNRWVVVRAATRARASELALTRFPGAQVLLFADPELDAQGISARARSHTQSPRHDRRSDHHSQSHPGL